MRKCQPHPMFAMLALTAACMAAHAQQPQPSVRRALLISNSKYQAIASLPATSTGSTLLQPVLKQMRFELRVVEDADLEQIDAAVSKLAADTHPGDVALVFYLGLAVQSQQENYLLPVTFDPVKTKGVDYEAYSMRRLASLVEERQPGFFGLIVDAAWDLPIVRQKFPEPGLVRLDPERPGSLFAMSASPGKLTGDGSKSLYAQALADALRQQGITLNQVLEYVKRSVSESSGGSQMPSEASSVVRDFYVNPKPADVLAWEAVKDTPDPAALLSFVKAHPSSKYTAEAAARLEDLDWKQATGKDAGTLRAFLQRYPGARHKQEAEGEIALLLALDALKRYKSALEARDLGQLKALWPGLTKQQQAGFQNFFRDAKGIAVESNPVGQITVNGDSAAIRAKRSIQFPGQGGTNDIVVLKLKRTGDEMLIESIAVENLGRL